LLRENFEYFQSLAKIEKIHDYSADLAHEVTATAVIRGAELFMPLAGLIDIEKEKSRLEKEINRLEGLAKGFSTKLTNEKFLNNAPEKVVSAEREKLNNVRKNLEKIKNNYKNLQKKL